MIELTTETAIYILKLAVCAFWFCWVAITLKRLIWWPKGKAARKGIRCFWRDCKQAAVEVHGTRFTFCEEHGRDTVRPRSIRVEFKREAELRFNFAENLIKFSWPVNLYPETNIITEVGPRLVVVGGFVRLQAAAEFLNVRAIIDRDCRDKLRDHSLGEYGSWAMLREQSWRDPESDTINYERTYQAIGCAEDKKRPDPTLKPSCGTTGGPIKSMSVGSRSLTETQDESSQPSGSLPKTSSKFKPGDWVRVPTYPHHPGQLFRLDAESFGPEYAWIWLDGSNRIGVLLTECEAAFPREWEWWEYRKCPKHHTDDEFHMEFEDEPELDTVISSPENPWTRRDCVECGCLVPLNFGKGNS